MSTTEREQPTIDDRAFEQEINPDPGVLATGPLTGSYTWDVDHDRWWWSDELYRIHGFEPGEVNPTTELWLAHKHPDDLSKVNDTIAGAVVHQNSFGCYHRIHDARRQERHLLLVGNAHGDPGSRSTQLRGFVADLTAARRDALQPAIDTAIEDVLVHRATIEQAKGAIMLAHGITPDAAFDILRTASQVGNTKLHTLAERFVARLTADVRLPVDHASLDGMLADATWAAT